MYIFLPVKFKETGAMEIGPLLC